MLSMLLALLLAGAEPSSYGFPVDDRAELAWMLGVAVHRDRPNRVLTLSQELYIKDLVDRYASHVSAGHTRKYDTPVEEGLRLSHDDCPAPNSPTPPSRW